MKSMRVVLNFFWLVTLSTLMSGDGNTDLWFDVDDVKNILRDVLEIPSQKTACSIILISDAMHASYLNGVAMGIHLEISTGYSLFVVTLAKSNSSAADQQIAMLTSGAQTLRKQSRCVMVLLFSLFFDNLVSFHKMALASHLLRGTNKLVVITRLEPRELKEILSHYWTYSMMNSLIINLDYTTTNRWDLYTHLPYTPDGPKNYWIGSYDPIGKLRTYSKQQLYPDKYSNFYGSTVNVSTLHYPPGWIEEVVIGEDGSKRKEYSGHDGELFQAVAEALNFTINVLAPSSWKEVGDLIASRKAYVSPVRWSVLPERLEVFDMTYNYDILPMAFCMAKPSLMPKWQSLYYPLGSSVWVAALGSLFVTPGILFMINYILNASEHNVHKSFISIILEIYGILLGQNLPRFLHNNHSSRTIIMVWLFFALVLASAYRSNLTAHLTVPKYPPRAETPEELVEEIDILSGEAYGSMFKEFFLRSGNAVYEKLGGIMVTGTETVEGLRIALRNRRRAVFGGKATMAFILMEKFTMADGSTNLYIGRSDLLSGPVAWPMPIGAPFKPNFDWHMQAAVEAGLKNKWISDVNRNSFLKSIHRQRKGQQVDHRNKDDRQASDVGKEASSVKLSLVEMQGPLFLLFLGFIFAFTAFGMEFIGSSS